jgi:hypothetical protein
MAAVNAIEASLDHRLLMSHQYALIAAEYIEQLPPDIPYLLTASGVLKDSVALLPVLVHLPALSSEQLDALQQLMNNPDLPVLTTLIKSTAEPARMAHHIGTAQLVRGIEERKAWLRIHDPRVWLQLRHVLTAQQRRNLMGPATVWTCRLDNVWVTEQVDNIMQTTATLLKTDAWQQLQRIGMVNRVLSKTGKMTIKGINERAEIIDSIVQRGQTRYALTRTEDLVEFAVLGETIHPLFDEHLDVVNVINAARQASDDFNVIDTLLTIDKPTWQRVKHDMSGKS